MVDKTQGIWGLRGFWRASSRRQRAAFAAILAAGVVFRIVGILQTDQTAVVNMPLPDDAFYYFTLARSAASGAGLTVSADGTATGGFQPLWALLLIAVQFLFGRLPGFDLITSAQVLGAFLGLASGLAVIGLAHRLSAQPWAGLLAGACALLSPQILKHNLNGMETSLAILASLVLIHVLIIPPERSLDGRRYLLVGLAGAMAVLARTDLVILVAAVLSLILIRATRDARREPESGDPGKYTLLLAAGLALPLLPWVLFSSAVGGSPIPESGAAVRNLTLLVRHQPFGGPIELLVESPEQILPFSLTNLVEFTSAWMRQTPVLLPALLPVFALLGTEAGLQLSALLAVPLVVAALWSFTRWRPSLWSSIVGWLLYAGLMAIAYSVFILGPWFYQRYAAPIAVLANPILIAAIAHQLPANRWSRWVPRVLTFLIGAAFAALVVSGSYAWILRGPRAVPDDGFYRTSLSIDEELPSGSRVGVFSAGLIGYYSDQLIIPLDGKVHRGARQALAEARMLEFLCEEEIGYLADWPEMVRNLVERRSRSWHGDALREVTRIEVEEYNDLVIVQVTDGACSR